MSVLKHLTNGFYDLQKLRIQAGNRVIGEMKSELGQEPGTTEEALDVKAEQFLKELRRSYKKISESIPAGKAVAPKNFKGDKLISEYSLFALVRVFNDLSVATEIALKDIGHELKNHPIWKKYLINVKGVGPTMPAVIISEFDITKAKYASSLWAYAGLDVAPDGKGRSKKKEHLVDVDYLAKDGEQKTKKSITYNPWLKSKLIGVLGSSFLKSGGEYKEVYDNYKHRLQNRPDLKDHSKGHIHAMATRYTVKIFLGNLYEIWRAMEGLPVYDPYHEEKLRMRSHKKIEIAKAG